MPRPRRSLEGTVFVDGVAFSWRLHREPQWCTADGWKGVAIAVEHAKAPVRTLIIEFPFEIQSHRSTPHRQRPKLPEKAIAAHIRGAIAQGWHPESRGKPFIFEVPVAG